MKEVFDNRFKELEAGYKAKGYSIVQAYKGEWSNDQVEGFAYELEAKLKESGIKKGIIKRVFSLIIEALQNIRLHGERDNDGVQQSFYFIALNEHEFEIMTANIIAEGTIEKVQTKIDRINSLDRAGLKEFYMDTLTDGKRSSKGGAGLGFITVAMKAKNTIHYSFDPLADGMFKFETWCSLSLLKKEE